MRGVLRVALMIAIGFGTAGLAVSACHSKGIIGDDCGPNVSVRCCPCPWPEECPDGPKPIPWDCPNACSGPPPLPARCTEDAGTDGGDAGMMSGLCAGGVCVPEAPDTWKAVAFVSSWASDPPECPADAPILAFEGTPAPPPPACGMCSCEAPEGSCRLPETWTVSSAGCDNPAGGVKTNYDPPTGWDGTCNEESALLPGKMCGADPCVRSITISPPVIEEQPCKAVTKGDPEQSLPRVWHGGPDTPIGRACASDKPAPTCPDQAGLCMPGGPAFSSCIMSEGDLSCPAGWEDRHLLYGKVEDSRECAACTCGDPSGGTCDLLVSIFGQPGCTLLRGTIGVSVGMIAPCHDFMPGLSLVGKTVDSYAYTAGKCAPSSGGVKGDLILDKPTTVCCFAPVI